MYINFNVMSSKDLSIYELGVLQLIKQNKIEDLSQEIEFLTQGANTLEKFLNIGYINFIKGNKKQTKYQLVRATKKANDALGDIETPEIDNDDLRLFEWLENVYKGLGKEAGNKRKCKNFISQFKVHSGITKNHLAFLCQTFINDDSQMDFSNKLEFLFFKGANLFSTKFDIYQSRLFQYYEKNKAFFDAEFLKINNK